MKLLLLLLVVVLAALAPPVSHSAHRRAAPHQRLRPIRVLRTPQAPKVVRAIR